MAARLPEVFNSLIRQPFLHFLVIGAGLFALFGLVNDTPDIPEKPQIVVSVQDAQWLASQHEATWRRPPSEQELSRLIDEFIREEVYVREALKFGLDQGDTIVRRRLRQKMEFLTEAGAEAAVVSDETLRAYYQENAEAYLPAAQVSFSQIMLADPTEDAVAQLLAELESGRDFRQLGARSMLPPSLTNASARSVDGTFGQGVFDSIATLAPGVWAGPVQTGFGLHLIRLDLLETGTLPDFDVVRDKVEQDWRRAQAERLRTERYDQLEATYEIVRPEAAAVMVQ